MPRTGPSARSGPPGHLGPGGAEPGEQWRAPPFGSAEEETSAIPPVTAAPSTPSRRAAASRRRTAPWPPGAAGSGPGAGGQLEDQLDVLVQGPGPGLARWTVPSRRRRRTGGARRCGRGSRRCRRPRRRRGCRRPRRRRPGPGRPPGGRAGPAGPTRSRRSRHRWPGCRCGPRPRQVASGQLGGQDGHGAGSHRPGGGHALQPALVQPPVLEPVGPVRGPSQVRVRSVGASRRRPARPAAARLGRRPRQRSPAAPPAWRQDQSRQASSPPTTTPAPALRKLRRWSGPAPTDVDDLPGFGTSGSIKGPGGPALCTPRLRLGRVVLDADQPLAHGQRGRLQLGVYAQLDQHVLHVGADGVERQVARLGDAAVGVAAGQQLQDLALALGQLRSASSAWRSRSASPARSAGAAAGASGRPAVTTRKPAATARMASASSRRWPTGSCRPGRRGRAGWPPGGR